MKKARMSFNGSCMPYVLISLTSNLVGVNDMKCNICKNPCKSSHINENYVAHANSARNEVGT